MLGIHTFKHEAGWVRKGSGTSASVLVVWKRIAQKRPWSAIVQAADVFASERPSRRPRLFIASAARLWTHFPDLQVARMVAIRLGLPTIFITPRL